MTENGRMRNILIKIACAAAALPVALAAAGGGSAVADPGNVSHVDEVTAVLSSEGITVSGQATFVDVPGVVGDDPTGDATGSEARLGTDITTATISRPDPFGDTLRFTLGIAHQPPEINGIPEFLLYRWHFTVTTKGRQTTGRLFAWRSNQWNNRGSVDPYFQLIACQRDPVTEETVCSTVNPVGTMGGGVVTWDVSMSDIGAKPGSVISSDGYDDGIVAVYSVSGASYGSKHGNVYDEVTGDPYTVPGPTVRMGIAPAGTADQDIPLAENGTVGATGAFDGLLPTPATPGEYTVAARACYGAGNCGLATTTITI